MSKLIAADRVRRISLRPETLIGRSHRSDLRIKDDRVSAMHALLSWTGAAWEVKDLGSRNGTLLNGRRLAPGDPVPVAEGAELVFGDESPWQFASGAPPAAFAVARERLAEAIADRLALPSVEEPEIVISPDVRGVWMAERIATGEEWPVQDREAITVGGTRWVLHLPGVAQSTVTHAGAVLAVPSLSLHFTARRGDEHVAIRAGVPGREVDLGAYTCYYLLLHLARARLTDAAEGETPPGEEGWRLQEEVLGALRINKLTLFSLTFRAKTYFAERGVLGTASLVERRRDSGEIRLGVARLVIDEG